MPTPTLFLDTNVCIDAATGRIPAGEWTRAQRYITRNFRYRISPHTLIELLIKIHRGDDAHFEKNQRPLKVLAGFGGAPQFLPFPGVFAARVLYQRAMPKPDFEPSDLRKWILVTLRAKSRADLLDGGVMLPGTVATRHGMDLTKVDGDLKVGRERHTARLERVREGGRTIPTRAEWGRLLSDVGAEPSNGDEALRITEAFDAAYVLDRELFQLARNHSYNFADHDTDYLDMNQLFYLCDPLVHFVTGERRLTQRIASSTQSGRVLRFEELLERAQAQASA